MNARATAEAGRRAEWLVYALRRHVVSAERAYWLTVGLVRVAREGGML